MADFEQMGKELKAELNLKVLYTLNPFWLESADESNIGFF
jgi:hypothetical protein